MYVCMLIVRTCDCGSWLAVTYRCKYFMLQFELQANFFFFAMQCKCRLFQDKCTSVRAYMGVCGEKRINFKSKIYFATVTNIYNSALANNIHVRGSGGAAKSDCRSKKRKSVKKESAAENYECSICNTILICIQTYIAVHTSINIYVRGWRRRYRHQMLWKFLKNNNKKKSEK